VVAFTVPQSCVPLRSLRAVFVMPRLSRFTPMRRCVLQVSRYVVVMRSGPRFICAERSYGGREQPNERSSTGSRQPLPNRTAQLRTAITGGGALLNSDCPRGANRLGPPPTLTTIEGPLIPAL
jgi:hypothetical protein